MTGYALTEKHLEQGFVSLEIKSYNSRYLDLNFNLPFWLSSLEPFFKSFISSHLARGKIDVLLRIKDLTVDVNIFANTKVATAYLKAMEEISKATGIAMSIDLTRFVEKDEILSIEKKVDLEFWQNLLKPIFQETIEKYNQTRSIEGDALKKDILFNLEKIISCTDYIKECSPKMEKIFSDTIKEKIKERFNINIDENRLAQELALMLVKYTINEEIVRLEAHCKNLRKELDLDHPIGKKIDFICQEINREINTIASKNQMLEITDSIITVKSALENIREQARNVE